MDPLVGRRSGGARPSTEKQVSAGSLRSPKSLLADLATLSDRIPLVRYAIRAALAEIKVWHVFPCPTRRPPCRGNPLTLAHRVFEAQVLPMLNSTFRKGSYLRVFGLTYQLKIVFNHPCGQRDRRN